MEHDKDSSYTGGVVTSDKAKYNSPSLGSLRCLVPIERRTAKGTLVFKTHDNQVYARMEDGSIRRATPKVNGKKAKKARRKWPRS